MSAPVLSIALAPRGHTRALHDGTVHPATCAFAFQEVPHIIQAFRRMVRGLEFDVSEMALTTYLCARAHGVAFTALPIFPMRALHHGAIVVPARSDIRSPRDLEGRKVGVSRGYTVTTGVWARAILQHEYDVDLRRITWVLSGDEHVTQYRPPANVVPIEAGQTLEAMLLSGEIAAAIGVQMEPSAVRSLIPNPREVGMAALRDRGLYPINHTVVVRNDRLAEDPGRAADIFSAFVEAKHGYVERLRAGTIEQPSADDRFFKEVMDVIGDPLPYGIEPNRMMLNAIVRHAVEQGILPQAVRVEDLFPAATHALAG